MTNQEYVQWFRDSGWKVKVMHERVNKFDKKWMYYGPVPNGGKTIGSLLRTVDGITHELRSEAKCSDKDNFVRKIGANLALERLYNACVTANY